MGWGSSFSGSWKECMTDLFMAVMNVLSSNSWEVTRTSLGSPWGLPRHSGISFWYTVALSWVFTQTGGVSVSGPGYKIPFSLLGEAPGAGGSCSCQFAVTKGHRGTCELESSTRLIYGSFCFWQLCIVWTKTSSWVQTWEPQSVAHLLGSQQGFAHWVFWVLL